MLNVSTNISTTHANIPANTHGTSTTRTRDSSVGGSRSASVVGRRSGEIIEEEDEDEIEEVDAFSPIVAGERSALGETVVEETIFEEGVGERFGLGIGDYGESGTVR